MKKFFKKMNLFTLSLLLLVALSCMDSASDSDDKDSGSDESPMYFNIENNSDLDLVGITEHSDEVEEIWSGSEPAGAVENKLELKLSEKSERSVGFTLTNDSGYEVTQQMKVDSKKYGRTFDVDLTEENGTYNQIKDADAEDLNAGGSLYSYTDIGLKASTTYYYKLKVIRDGFISDYSGARSGEQP